jgi:SAM-dependent methyltransferase
MLTIIFIILNLLFALLIFFLTLAFITGAPFVPSTGKVTAKMIEFGGIKPGMKVYDLGSGDGRLLFAAARLGATAVGFEINPFLVFLTRIRILLSPYRKSVKVCWKNFWTADICDADVIFVYLIPLRMSHLARKLRESLRSGTAVISNSFIFPDWEVEKKDAGLHVFAFRMK